jgi:N-acetylneuraminate lyase
MLAALSDADFAQARGFQNQAVALVRLLMRYGFMAASKAVMGWLGVECGEPRAPYPALSENQHSALRKELDAFGFFGPPFQSVEISEPQAASSRPFV